MVPRSERSIYHGDCNNRFQSSKKPGVDNATLSRKCGRPKFNQRKEPFEEFLQYLCQNDEEQITVSKVNDMMKEKVSVKPYFVFAIFYEGPCLSLFCLYARDLL